MGLMVSWRALALVGSGAVVWTSSAVAAPLLSALVALPGGIAGAAPSGGLIADASGSLYGVASQDGTGKAGLVYRLSPPATAGAPWTETVLHAFNGTSEGAIPAGPLVGDAQGHLYGVTEEAGSACPAAAHNLCGTVYMLTPPAKASAPWKSSVLWTFNGGTAGLLPAEGLVIDAHGSLFGATAFGGTTAVCKADGQPGCGMAFELSPPSVTGRAKWTLAILHKFAGGSDGEAPQAPPVFDPAGNLYVASSMGGSGVKGSVLKLTPPAAGQSAWTSTVIWQLSFSGFNGFTVGLALDRAGDVFGATSAGGPGKQCSGASCGIMFELTPPSGSAGWAEQVVWNFGPGLGAVPLAAPLIDSAGRLYVATGYGKAGDGALLSLTPAAAVGGAWTGHSLWQFTGGADGGVPSMTLLPDAKGNLYGTTSAGGGSANTGTAFEITGTGYKP